jgi:CBS domain-containing protein
VFGRHSSWTFPLFTYRGTSYFVHVSAAVFLLLYIGSIQDSYTCSSLDLIVLTAGAMVSIVAHEVLHQKTLWFVDATRIGTYLRSLAIRVLGNAAAEIADNNEYQTELAELKAIQPSELVDSKATKEDLSDVRGSDNQLAKSEGANIHSVTLFPFGGISEVAGRASAWALGLSGLIAPLGSFLIAFVFGLAFSGELFPTAMVDVINGDRSEFSLFLELARVNWFLGVINLVPFLPFDGGVLLLSMRRIGAANREGAKTGTGEELAERFSTWSLVGCGAGIGLAWLSYSSLLLVVAFASALIVTLRLGLLAQAYGAAGALRAMDAMIATDRLVVLSHGTRLTSALTQSLKSFQSVFPIVKGAELMGMVEREDLLKATQRSEGYVAEFVRGEMLSVRPTAPLKDVVSLFESMGVRYLPVIEDSQFKGIIVKERLFELLLVRGMEEMRQRMPSDDDWFDM